MSTDREIRDGLDDYEDEEEERKKDEAFTRKMNARILMDIRQIEAELEEEELLRKLESGYFRWPTER